MNTTVQKAPSLLLALDSVLSPVGFPYASNGRLFKDGQFGRDALETAEDLLDIRPDIAHAVIMRLAQLQGTESNPTIGEEPGKIHHEYRALVMDGRHVEDESMRILHFLAHEWHVVKTDEEDRGLTELLNYFTVDATPRFILLVASYRERYGDEILAETFQPHGAPGGEPSTIGDSVRAAVNWVAGQIEGSDISLLEWRRKTPWEHRFQAWKDGGTSYLHEDGSFANYLGPIASIEVQGLAYDALLAAADLLISDSPGERERLVALASKVRNSTLTRFWMPDHEYFAMALDRDSASGTVRQVRLLTSNAAALLDSGLLDATQVEERETYVAPLISRVFGPEFLTRAGIRCTSLLHRDVQDYPAYQSAYTVWHKETYDIAKGLRRQGYLCLAGELERRLLNTINLAGPKEFIYVMPDGRVDCGPSADSLPGETVELLATNHPENDQAWTVAAALAVKWRNGRRTQTSLPDPHHAFEDGLLEHAGRTRLFRTHAEIEAARPTDYTIHVDTERGYAHEKAWMAAHTLQTTA